MFGLQRSVDVRMMKRPRANVSVLVLVSTICDLAAIKNILDFTSGFTRKGVMNIKFYFRTTAHKMCFCRQQLLTSLICPRTRLVFCSVSRILSHKEISHAHSCGRISC